MPFLPRLSIYIPPLPSLPVPFPPILPELQLFQVPLELQTGLLLLLGLLLIFAFDSSQKLMDQAGSTALLLSD